MPKHNSSRPLIREIEYDIIYSGAAMNTSQINIDDLIVGQEYHVFPETTIAICLLKLKNGFAVTGESPFVSPEIFDREVALSIARGNARAKIWALEGYHQRKLINQPEETQALEVNQNDNVSDNEDPFHRGVSA